MPLYVILLEDVIIFLHLFGSKVSFEQVQFGSGLSRWYRGWRRMVPDDGRSELLGVKGKKKFLHNIFITGFHGIWQKHNHLTPDACFSFSLKSCFQARWSKIHEEETLPLTEGQVSFFYYFFSHCVHFLFFSYFPLPLVVHHLFLLPVFVRKSSWVTFFVLFCFLWTIPYFLLIPPALPLILHLQRIQFVFPLLLSYSDWC